jgi:hypothetical protein
MALAIVQMISGALGIGFILAFLVTGRKNQRLVQLAGVFVLITSVCIFLTRI